VAGPQFGLYPGQFAPTVHFATKVSCQTRKPYLTETLGDSCKDKFGKCVPTRRRQEEKNMKDKLLFPSLPLLILFLILAPTALASNLWYVDGVHGNDQNKCRTPVTACKTIGHAISLASSGDFIFVAGAIYPENLTLSFSLNVIGSSATTTIIDGGGVNTVVTISSATVTLSGLTIQHGDAALGGGIDNSGTLTLNNSTVTQNQAQGMGTGGGGIYNSGILTINNGTISGNSNSASRYRGGGGILNFGGILTIKNSTISGNSAHGFSGVVSKGGGIYNAGTLTLNNSTLSGNSAVVAHGPFGCAVPDGGGIYSQSGTVTINNSTVSGNFAENCYGDGDGGGIYGNVTLQNTIVANSPYGGNCDGTMTSNGYNLSSDNTCNFHQTGDLNNTNPLLGPLQNNGGPTQTEALLDGSPAIDSGNPSGCTDGQGHLLNTDQRGMPRPDREDSGGCDRGAYERQSD